MYVVIPGPCLVLPKIIFFLLIAHVYGAQHAQCQSISAQVHRVYPQESVSVIRLVAIKVKWIIIALSTKLKSLLLIMEQR